MVSFSWIFHVSCSPALTSAHLKASHLQTLQTGFSGERPSSTDEYEDTGWVGVWWRWLHEDIADLGSGRQQQCILYEALPNEVTIRKDCRSPQQSMLWVSSVGVLSGKCLWSLLVLLFPHRGK